MTNDEWRDTDMGEYIYLGDKNTDAELRGKVCFAVRRADGKCIRGKNGSMLVSIGETKMVIVGRLLRRIEGGKPKIQRPKPTARSKQTRPQRKL